MRARVEEGAIPVDLSAYPPSDVLLALLSLLRFLPRGMRIELTKRECRGIEEGWYLDGERVDALERIPEGFLAFVIKRRFSCVIYAVASRKLSPEEVVKLVESGSRPNHGGGD